MKAAHFLGLGAIVLLSAGLLVAQSGLASRAALADDGRPQMEMVIAVEQVINGEVSSGTVRVRFEDPPELPQALEGSGGLYLGLDGDILTVGQGSIEVEVGVEVVNDEEPVRTVSATHDGGEAQIRVTAGTVIYEDSTQDPEITEKEIAAGEMVLTRSVKAGSLGDIGAGMMIRAWGVKQNGQFVADVLVYKPLR